MNTRARRVGPKGLTQYLRTIYEYPMLSAEEELALSCAWRDSRDHAAADKLVTSHLRLVARIAMNYRGYGLPLDELIGEGNMGMIRAVERFDPARGFRLSTYAKWWIRAAIQEYILHSWSLVKIGTTVAQKKLFFNLRRIKGQMHVIGHGDLETGQVAGIMCMLGVPEHEVISMNRRLARDYSLTIAVYKDDDDQWHDRLVDDAIDQETAFAEREEQAVRKTVLGEAFNLLNKREQHILAERWLKDDPTTLDDLGALYGISGERVRQVEKRAMAKLRKAVQGGMVTGSGGTRPLSARPSGSTRTGTIVCSI